MGERDCDISVSGISNALTAGIGFNGVDDMNQSYVPAIWTTFTTINATRSFFIVAFRPSDISTPPKTVNFYTNFSIQSAHYTIFDQKIAPRFMLITSSIDKSIFHCENSDSFR
jgi:hypothetical protein